MSRAVTSLAAGVLFGAGLVVSGMTQPSKVVAFLDVAGAWDPSLAVVMVGAIAVHLLAHRLARRLPSPVLGGEFALTPFRRVDTGLLAGSALFGIGWGLGGFCPGPGLASVCSGSGSAGVFVVAMLAGMGVHEVLRRIAGRRGI